MDQSPLILLWTRLFVMDQKELYMTAATAPHIIVELERVQELFAIIPNSVVDLSSMKEISI